MAGNDIYTKLLLHMDGTNGSTSFVDSSLEEHTVIRASGDGIDTIMSTDQKKFGVSSAFFDGDRDELAIANTNDDWTFGTGDFTIDLWFYPLSIGVDSAIFSKGFYQSGDVGNYGLQIQTNKIEFSTWDSTSNNEKISATPIINTGEWYHVAVTRESGVAKIYLNGTPVVSGTISKSLGVTYSPMIVGRDYHSNPDFHGYIDEFRVSKGIARWAETFTVPTSPYTRTVNNIKGAASESMRIIIINENSWTTETTSLTNGEYDITTTSGLKTVIGRKSDGQCLSYGGITPNTEEI